MTDVLDADVLDDTILDATLTCANCDGEAEWRWSTRCCGAAAHLCDTHDATGYTAATRALLDSFAMCGSCGKCAGYGVRFADFYRRTEL